MNLSQSNIPFLVLNVNLKTGLIAGVLGVSLVTGTITLANNYSEINEKIRKSVEPVATFLNPYFIQLHTGVVNIGSKTKDWALLLKDKPAEMWTWLEKNAEFSKITSGASQIQTKLADWYPLIKTFAISIKNWLLELDFEKFRGYSKVIYTTATTIYELIDQFTTIFSQLIEKLQNDPTGVSAESSMFDSLGNIVQSENGTTTLQNLAKTFFDNSNLLSELGMENIAAIVGMAAHDETNFNSKVKELSENNTSSDSEEKWGSYSSPDKLLSALDLKNVAEKAKLVQSILKITQCPKDQHCGSNYEKIISDFFDSIKTQIESLKNQITGADAFLKDLTPDKYFEEATEGKENNTKKIIDKIIEVVSQDSKKK